MKLIKPHLDSFYCKYEVMFDGNDYYVLTSTKSEYPWQHTRDYYVCKFGALLFLFFARRAQHKELKERIRRDARFLKEPIKIA